jgi:hypothetical protein
MSVAAQSTTLHDNSNEIPLILEYRIKNGKKHFP